MDDIGFFIIGVMLLFLVNYLIVLFITRSETIVPVIIAFIATATEITTIWIIERRKANEK